MNIILNMNIAVFTFTPRNPENFVWVYFVAQSIDFLFLRSHNKRKFGIEEFVFTTHGLKLVRYGLVGMKEKY